MGLNETWTPVGLSLSLCPSFAVVPLLGTALVRPVSLCLSPICSLAWGSRGSCRVSCKGSVSPAHHFPLCQLGNHPGGDSDTRCAGRLAPAEQCKPSGGFLPSEAQEGQNLLPLCKLLKGICCFPGFYFSQACLKLLSEFVRCDWHFDWSAFFRERVKNLVLHRCKSLVTVVLKHWNPA